jgi:hypothetical protein
MRYYIQSTCLIATWLLVFGAHALSFWYPSKDWVMWYKWVWLGVVTVIAMIGVGLACNIDTVFRKRTRH